MENEEAKIIYGNFGESRLTPTEQTLAGLAILGYDLHNLPEALHVDASGRSRLVAEAMFARLCVEDSVSQGDTGALQALSAVARERMSLLDGRERARVEAELVTSQLGRTSG